MGILNYKVIHLRHGLHIGDPRSGPIRQYYDRLRTEFQQNQTNPHNILTQVNIGVQDEVRVKITSNDNLKRNIRRWRQEAHAAPVPSNIDFPFVPDLYHRTTRDTIFLRKDTGPTSDRMLIFFTDEQRNIMENSTNHGFKQKYETDITFAHNIHKILALAFLEPTQVINGFESLCSELGEEYQEILDYFEDNYIGRLRGRSRRPATFPINIWNMNT
ncbi:unnamed protein product, partial [Rotaria sordida]